MSTYINNDQALIRKLTIDISRLQQKIRLLKKSLDKSQVIIHYSHFIKNDLKFG